MKIDCQGSKNADTTYDEVFRLINESRTKLWSRRLDTTQTNLIKATGILGVLCSVEMAVHFGGHFIESYYIGRLGPAYLSGVALSTVVLSLTFGFFVELGTGLTNLVAQYIGANNLSAAAVAIGQAILLCVGVSFPLSIAGALLAPKLLLFVGADAAVMSVGTPYLRLSFATMSILILPFVLNAALRALGNASLPIWIEVLQLAALLLIMPITVLGLGPIPRLEALGAMVALVVARVIATVIQVAFFFSGHSVIRLHAASFRPHGPTVRRLISLSLPSTGQQLMRYGADAAVIRLVAVFGTPAIAGFSLSLLFLRMLETIGNGIGNATFTIVGQNLGARQGHRALRGTWIAVGYSLIAIGIGILIQVIFAPSLIAIFNSEPSVIAIGSASIRMIAGSFLFSAVAYVLKRSFHGAGDTVSPLIVDLIILWAVQLPLALGLSLGVGWGTNGIWVAIAVANTIRALMLVSWFRRSAQRRFVVDSL